MSIAIEACKHTFPGEVRFNVRRNGVLYRATYVKPGHWMDAWKDGGWWIEVNTGAINSPILDRNNPVHAALVAAIEEHRAQVSA